MRKILTLLILCIFSFATMACLREKKPESLMEKIIKNDKLVVGVKIDAKPFGFEDKEGTLQGFDVELARKIAENLLGDSSKIEFVPVTSSNRIITLTSGKVDMVIATMSITSQREQIVDFSDPYFIAGQALMIPKNSSIQGVTDLADKKVIVILGTTGERNIKRFVPKAILRGFKTNREAYNALKTGIGDALTTDDTILAGFLMDDDSMKILSKRYTQEPYAVAFRKDEESQSLKHNVNHILEHLKDSGEINRLKNKWLNFN